MAGVKGRSGRRSKSEEEKRREVLQLAWNLHYTYLSNSSVSIEDKLKYANPILIKDMVGKVEGTMAITDERRAELLGFATRLGITQEIAKG